MSFLFLFLCCCHISFIQVPVLYWGFGFQGSWVVLLFKRWESRLWWRTQQGLRPLTVRTGLWTRLIICLFISLSFLQLLSVMPTLCFVSLEVCFAFFTWMQGITLNGMRTILFTLLGTQPVLRLFVFCSKCLLIRLVQLFHVINAMVNNLSFFVFYLVISNCFYNDF